MKQFLPDANETEGIGFFTSCFLVLHKNIPADANSQARATTRDQVFLNDDTLTAFRQRLDPAELEIDDKEVTLFIRALRLLNIQPSFHLTELEPSLACQIANETLAKISRLQLKGWPKVSSKCTTTKCTMLEYFLKDKDKGYYISSYKTCQFAKAIPELKKQRWPQLMLLAASDVVAPDYRYSF